MVIVPAVVITFSTMVRDAMELPQEAPSVTITSIKSPPEIAKL